MVTVKVYVEGGGDDLALHTKCRKGFRVFFENACFKGRMPRIVACGSRADAYDSFCTALKSVGANQFPILLVDGEGPVTSAPWLHVKARAGDGWDKPAGAADDHLHLMVQCMEAWFLADKDHLAGYYGQGFIPRHLPGKANVEQVAKADAMRGLKMATRGTKKGEYSKGSHSFEILEGINPAKIKNLPHVKRLFVVLDAKLQ